MIDEIEKESYAWRRRISIVTVLQGGITTDTPLRHRSRGRSWGTKTQNHKITTSGLIIHKYCVNLCGSLWIFVDIYWYLWIFVDIAFTRTVLYYVLFSALASADFRISRVTLVFLLCNNPGFRTGPQARAWDGCGLRLDRADFFKKIIKKKMNLHLRSESREMI